MSTKLQSPNGPAKSSPPMAIEVSAFERELPYFRQYGVPFEIIEQSSNTDLVRVKITIVDSAAFAAYGIAMSKYGFDQGKREWLSKTLFQPRQKEVVS